MKFILNCIPPKATHQGSLRIMKARDGRMFVGKQDSSTGAAAKRLLSGLLLPFRPDAPMEGPLEVNILWVYPWRKSEKKANIERFEIPCDTRPDCDNLSKTLMDLCTKLRFWNDDSQVSDLIFRKRWGERPRIEISIEKAGTLTQGKLF